MSGMRESERVARIKRMSRIADRLEGRSEHTGILERARVAIASELGLHQVAPGREDFLADQIVRRLLRDVL